MSTTIDQQFVEFIVKSLVGNPDAVKIERRIDEKGVLLELTVDPEDLGRVIGKRGATAQSLRTLLRALGTKNDARYNLKIIDDGDHRDRRTDRFDERKDIEEPKEKPAKEEPKKGAKKTKTDEVTEAHETTAEEIAGAKEPNEEHDSVISRTRKELEEFDDLDV